ncbi:hypothetical protein [Blautia marasmi]|uniref:hypothetical protein n=1 Tax=Blautia marasmi TaxID=1917868 RepID=UPI00266BD1D8|nr:hypothetical protein [Blautia marasmi]
MTNNDNMNIQLTRLETLDISMSIILLIHDVKNEMDDPETTESRKTVLKSTLKKWENLRIKIKKQFEEQDISHSPTRRGCAGRNQYVSENICLK